MLRSIVDVLRNHAGAHPDRSLYNFHNLKGDTVESVTYGDFDRTTNHLAARLAGMPGIEPGRPVLLAFGPRLAMITSFFACAKMGAIPVPVPPISAASGHSGLERLGKIAIDSGAQAILYDGRQHKALLDILASRPRASEAPGITAAAELNWIDPATMSGMLDEFDATPGKTLFLQYTSGSTSAPRGAVISHANVIANSPAPQEAPRVTLSWLPHFHDMGLIGYHLFPLICGDTAHLFSPADFLRRPALWLELITRMRVTHTSAPNFAFDYCARKDRVSDEVLARLDLSSLQDIMNASEPVRCDTLTAFRERFAACGLKDSALTAAYGLAENTLRVTVGGTVQLAVNKERLANGHVATVRGKSGLANAVRFASCGRPVPQVDLRIVDPETGAEMPASNTGEIWVAGPSKAEGYWGRPELSRDIFQAKIAGALEDRAYLRTGDIGFIDEGALYVCGRIRDMTVLRGKNVFPNDVEAAILAHFPRIEPGRVAVFGYGAEHLIETGLVILVEDGKGARDVPLTEIQRVVVLNFQVPVECVAQIRRGSLPKTSSGKIARHLCQSSYAKGDFEILASLRPENVGESEESVTGLLDGLLLRSGATAGDDTTISELGLDSLELVDLSVRIEELARLNGIAEEQRLNTVYDLRLLQTATVGKVKHVVAGLAAKTAPVDLIASTLADAIVAIETDEAKQMRRDAALNAALVPSARTDVDAGDGAVLVTGSTGFVGCFLLEALLRLTRQPLVALVRAENGDHGRMRLRTALLRAGLSPGQVEHAMRTRIEVVCGDVVEPRLGLTEAEWHRLSQTVATVYHSAAEVDYLKTYRELMSANVVGTEEVIRFCCDSRAKVLNHISTTFVFGWTTKTVKGEDDRNSGMEWLDFGYPQSKWVSEQLVYQAGERGLAVRVFRPSLITASRSGHYMRGDISSRAIGYCIRHAVALSAENQLSFLPVDVCANNIVAIANQPASSGRTFHLTANHYYTMETVCRLITDLYGYPFHYVDMDGYVDHINARCGPVDDLFPLKPFFNNSREKFKAMDRMRYDNRSYREFCLRAPEAMAEPPLGETVTWLVDFLIANKLVPPPEPDFSQLPLEAERV